MAENIVNPPSPSRYEHYYLPNNSGAVSYLPLYSRRRRSPEEPIPLLGTRNRLVNIEYPQIMQSIDQFRTRGYIPLPEVTFDWVDFIARQLYGKSNNYIRAFMKRYIITDTLISRDHEERLRRVVLDILRRVATKESLEEAVQFLRDTWEVNISLNPSDPDTYELLVLFLDTEALHRMFENGVEYNQRGIVKLSPGRRRMSLSGARGVGGVRGVRSKKRTRQMKVSPAIYEGGRRNKVKLHRRTTRRKNNA
jgi:hypothetical protein